MPTNPGNAPSERIRAILEDVDEMEYYANYLWKFICAANLPLQDFPKFPQMVAVVRERERQKHTAKNVDRMRKRMQSTRLAVDGYLPKRPESLKQLNAVIEREQVVTFKDEPLSADEIAASVQQSNREAGMKSREESIRKAQEKFSADPMASKLAVDKSKFTIGE